LPRDSSRVLRPPALLASASYLGTIAAVRNLGANGIEVRVLSDRYILDAAGWSCFASCSYRTPPETESESFLARLMDIGAHDPGQVLLPTSDETAWLYTANAALLQQYFCVYQPPIATMRRLLDKQLLTEAAVNAGLSVLPSWAPPNIDELVNLAPTLSYPILVKPRTHVHHRMNDKGMVVGSVDQLIGEFQQRNSGEHIRVGDDSFVADDQLPILQPFVSVGKEGIRSVTGFINRAGDLFVTRHAMKVFQRTEPLGVGVCFESLPNSPELSEAVRRLCREVNFFGVFEVEFIWYGGRWNAIDFNPRFFNQIKIDICRGLPLPLLSYLDAIGEEETLREAVAKAQIERGHEKVILFDRFTLRAILFAKLMTSRMSRECREYWRAWMDENLRNAIDIAADRKDRMPGIVHAISEIQLGLKAVPRFLRTKPRRKVDAIESVARE
jgi:D-aspartate ligase